MVGNSNNSNNNVNNSNVLIPSDASNVYISGFTGQTASYYPLKTAIADAIKVAKGTDPDAQKKLEEEKKQFEAQEKLIKQQQKNLNLFDSFTNKFIDALEKNEKVSKDTLDKWTTNLAKASNFLDMVGDILAAFKDVFDNTKKRFEWIKELERSGVHLVQGFDDSFTELANMAKMSHDSFTKMLAANSQSIAKLNAINIDGARTFSESLNKVVGKFGYTTEEASTALSSYMNNVVNFYSKESLSEKLKNDATTQYLKNLKELSAATGKSVELLVQENQLKEDTLFAKKLMSEHPALYGLYKQMGLNDAQIKAAVTGMPNDDSVLMQATPQGRELYHELRQLALDYTTGKLSTNKLISRGAKIANGRAAESARDIMHNMDYSMANIYSMSKGHNTMFGSILLNKLDEKTGKRVVENEGDTELVNRLINYEAEKDIFENNQNEKLALSVGKATTALNFFTGGLWAANVAIGFHSVLALGKIVFGSSAARAFLSRIFFGAISGGSAARAVANSAEPYLPGIISTNPITNGINKVGNALIRGAHRLENSMANLSSRFIKVGTSLKILGAGIVSFAAGFGFAKLFGASNRTAMFSGTGSTIGGYVGMGIGAFFGMPHLGWIAGSILGGLAGAGLASLTDKKSTGPATDVSNITYKNEYAYNSQTLFNDKKTTELLTSLDNNMKKNNDMSEEQTKYMRNVDNNGKFVEMNNIHNTMYSR